MESRFAEAQQCFADALRQSSGRPELVADLFAYRAAIFAARRRDTSALEAIQVVLALDPSWEPTDPLLTSPKVRELLERGRSSFSLPRGPLRLSHTAPTDGDGQIEGETLDIEVEIENLVPPLEAVVMVRRQGQRQFRRVPLRQRAESISADSSVFVALLPLSPGEEVAYYVGIATPGGWFPILQGSPDEPLLASRQATPDGGSRGQVSFARRFWWVWALIGVAAAGATVGLAVGLTAGSSPSTGSVELRFPIER